MRITNAMLNKRSTTTKHNNTMTISLLTPLFHNVTSPKGLNVFYSTETSSLNKLFSDVISETTVLDPHPGLIIATHKFSGSPCYPCIDEIGLLSLATMDLLNQYAYPSLSGYAKFTISLTIRQPYGEEIRFTIGTSIPLTTNKDQLIPKASIFHYLNECFIRNAEAYIGSSIIDLMIRVYTEQKLDIRPSVSNDDRYLLLRSIMSEGARSSEPIPESSIRKIQHKKRNYSSGYITALKRENLGRKPFIVADLETVLIMKKDEKDGKEKVLHIPYAGGVMLVRPGHDVQEGLIHTNFSEDYKIFIESFEKRSNKMLFDLVNKIISIVKKEKTANTVYFHNFSRFDGIFILKHLALHHHDYKLKTLMRNNRLYEISVYTGKKKNRLLFRCRDSLNLLPGKLNDLAASLCPSLGSKGSIDYENVSLSNLEKNKESLVDYMMQDIRLLGGVMQRAQEIYYDLFKLDIVSKITLSSVALSIFRLRYYDETNWPIHIPNMNQDSFIRKAYYGGHTDIYKPYGKNLYYYDVNSLYPYIMKSFQMPGGEPVWHGNLDDKDLESLYGFIEAYVVCPETIKKPFLPYRDKKTDTLIFPTGAFVGVYYSEELKFAKSLGYTVLPLSGYLYERKESPFDRFVNELFSSRLEAKKEGNEALSYVYKILMNSLYGRFGINPTSTTAEICDKARYNQLVRKKLIFADLLKPDCYIVSYHVNTSKDSDEWNPPTNSAVQLSAAITACARIYMYPFISREDCYYTDTDSVVLGQPLPDEWISPSVLGMFKLEDRIVEGYFLAPKSYSYTTVDENQVTKYKGAAKNKIGHEWFISQYEDPSRTLSVLVESTFRINWSELNIEKEINPYNITLRHSKRLPLYDHCKKWVDTEPMHIKELSNIGPNNSERILFYLMNEVNRYMNEVNQYRSNNLLLNEKISQMGLEKDREISEMIRQIDEIGKNVSSHINQTDTDTKTDKVTKTDTDTKTDKDTKIVKKPP